MVLHSVKQLCGSFDFFYFLKRSGCTLCYMVSVVLAYNGDIVSLYTGWFIVTNISTLDSFIALYFSFSKPRVS